MHNTCHGKGLVPVTALWAVVFIGLAVLAGCDSRATRVSGPSFENQSNPPPDDCTSQGCFHSEGAISESNNTAVAMAGDVSGLPAWHGENPATDPPRDGAFFECAPFVDDPHFIWGGRHYKIFGRAFLTYSFTSPGMVPIGAYLLPMGPHPSDDGQWVIWSGTIQGKCNTWRLQIRGLIVWTGWMQWYYFSGDEGPASTGPGSGSSHQGGWAFGETGGTTRYTFTNGASDRAIPQDVLDVINAYMTDRTCTAGWDIWIDDTQVCWG